MASQSPQPLEQESYSKRFMRWSDPFTGDESQLLHGNGKSNSVFHQLSAWDRAMIVTLWDDNEHDINSLQKDYAQLISDQQYLTQDKNKLSYTTQFLCWLRSSFGQQMTVQKILNNHSKFKEIIGDTTVINSESIQALKNKITLDRHAATAAINNNSHSVSSYARQGHNGLKHPLHLFYKFPELFTVWLREFFYDVAKRNSDGIIKSAAVAGTWFFQGITKIVRIFTRAPQNFRKNPITFTLTAFCAILPVTAPLVLGAIAIPYIGIITAGANTAAVALPTFVSTIAVSSIAAGSIASEVKSNQEIRKIGKTLLTDEPLSDDIFLKIIELKNLEKSPEPINTFFGKKVKKLAHEVKSTPQFMDARKKIQEYQAAAILRSTSTDLSPVIKAQYQLIQKSSAIRLLSHELNISALDFKKTYINSTITQYYIDGLKAAETMTGSIAGMELTPEDAGATHLNGYINDTLSAIEKMSEGLKGEHQIAFNVAIAKRQQGDDIPLKISDTYKKFYPDNDDLKFCIEAYSTIVEFGSILGGLPVVTPLPSDGSLSGNSDPDSAGSSPLPSSPPSPTVTANGNSDNSRRPGPGGTLPAFGNFLDGSNAGKGSSRPPSSGYTASSIPVASL